jgi:peptidoglycan hydrolase CwlO-like protein
MNIKLASAVLVSLLAIGLTACSEGPAESAGKKVDNAVESVKDTVLDKGPAEKAGEKIDKAVDKVGEKVEEVKQDMNKPAQ